MKQEKNQCKYYSSELACRNYCKAPNDCIEPLSTGQYCCMVSVPVDQSKKAIHIISMCFWGLILCISIVWMGTQIYFQYRRKRPVTHFDDDEIDALDLSQADVDKMRRLLSETEFAK